MTHSPFMQRLRDIEHTVRGSFLGFTAMLPLIAAGTVDPDPTAAQIATLFTIAVNFHLFGYLHNDLTDLPVDRTQPQRAQDPLITGKLKVEHAWLIVVVQPPISFALLWWMGAGLDVYGILLLGYLATIGYNFYGKRCPVPMVTDALQGVAWFSLAAFGAAFVGGFNTLTATIAGFGFAFIFLINGVHGGLRDLGNDLGRDRITTAIYFGARPVDATRIVSPPGLRYFAAFAMALLVLPGAFVLATNAIGYATPTWIAATIVWVGLNGASIWYMRQILKEDLADRRRWIYAHQLPLLAPPLVLFVPALDWPLRIVVLATWMLMLLLFSEPVNRLIAAMSRFVVSPRRQA